jgi:hypothetical protein
MYGALVNINIYADRLTKQVPVFPFALGERIGTPEDKIQSIVSQLLAAFAFGALITKYGPKFSHS